MSQAERMRQEAAAARHAAEQRYQIGQMERVLEGAVEHGVTVTRDRLQAIAQVPAETLVSDNAHARGFRLDGYGVFFDVEVPSFFSTLTWSLRTLDQNDLGLDSALRALQSHVKTTGDPNLEQALKRIELQVNPAVLTRTTVPDVPDARTLTGSAATTAPDKAAPSDDPILRTQRGVSRRGDAGAEGRHAGAQQFARHRAHRVADDCRQGQRRSAAAGAGRQRRADADHPPARIRSGRLPRGRITRDEAMKRIEVRVF
jgi:hypothetical protein